MQCKCVNIAGQQFGQRLVYCSVAPYQRLSVEPVANQCDLEVGFGSLGNVMHVALIDNFNQHRLKLLLQNRSDCLFS